MCAELLHESRVTSDALFVLSVIPADQALAELPADAHVMGLIMAVGARLGALQGFSSTWTTHLMCPTRPGLSTHTKGSLGVMSALHTKHWLTP